MLSLYNKYIFLFASILPTFASSYPIDTQLFKPIISYSGPPLVNRVFLTTDYIEDISMSFNCNDCVDRNLFARGIGPGKLGYH
ncbi:hypothetical protein COEREDRAFT_79846 [Coemansia reversa NRRL 1564]|uniref:Uncharacterized protein n=1 Tax=Coemansia reversa (strain ATCC 12441 / NRRL 1564) TaxID=763665 RepID=A0A2G5BH79_COERN|nr:hypothetical protein COEREDRAFT_79846 [Coemansia reversa NRRL 1564]|eukprot:PIA18369.1 hypothetical protein COEREDRAFT_79846 [Coemansia reversa NRRL 1564]